MKRLLLPLGILFPILLILELLIYKKLEEDITYIDCWEMNGRIYRFNKRLKKKDYERLRDNFCCGRQFTQCTTQYTLQDFEVDVETLISIKSIYYSEYHGVC